MSIRDRILARSDLDALRAARDITALAAALNTEAPTEPAESWVDALGIINRCAHGKTILRKLAAGAGADVIVSVAWQSLIGGKGLDFGAASTQESIAEMAGLLGFTEAEVAELAALGQKTIVVTQEQVGNEMYHPDGTEK
jgi:hypothetical protein